MNLAINKCYCLRYKIANSLGKFNSANRAVEVQCSSIYIFMSKYNIHGNFYWPDNCQYIIVNLAL